ncbi:uncharacterized protein BHQ10_005617 [Talaromyces amestolkiae]|uniref:Uncharacterized protein n=1 Tax=Talaromyces amestolkiae TaxID=1196081 RepID=A0A364L1D0_TALAM|nr:uncharacterized protein BHQ10_005617 [Talaromyces amestolkiae]RAO69605.1 hypothetical protein BHQ10_005617 [Talaromyces amestolkiae]
MQYRRITEVIEDDNKIERPSSQPGSANAKTAKANPDRVHVFIGPKTPAEADTTGDDVTQFKRVHIIAGPDTRRPAAGTLQPLASTDLNFDMNTYRRPTLPAPTELFNSGTVLGTDAYSLLEDSSPITVSTRRVFAYESDDGNEVTMSVATAEEAEKDLLHIRRRGFDSLSSSAEISLMPSLHEDEEPVSVA